MNAWNAWAWRIRLSRLSASAFVCLAATVLLLFLSLPGRKVLAKSSGASGAPTGCESCHAGVSASYAHAGMQHALQAPGVDPVLNAHPNLSVQIGNYPYAVQTKDGQSTYTVADGTGLLTLPIRWTFGQYSQTWVLEKDGVITRAR